MLSILKGIFMNKIIGLILLFSLSAFALPDATHYKIVPGKLHQGGKASANIISTDAIKKVMLVRLNYEVYKKALVPVPEEYLKGSSDQELPLEFIDERGYLNLEAMKTQELEDAILIHLGRVAIAGHINGHHVRIKAKNGRSETDVYYHPHLPELGWGKVRLVLHTPIPMLKNYAMEAVLKDL